MNGGVYMHIPEGKGEAIHVVYSVYDLSDIYNRHIGASLTSLLFHSSEQIVVHLLYDEQLHKDDALYLQNRTRYHKLCRTFGAELLFHNVEIPESFYSFRASKNLTVGTYYRLFIADVLRDINKVIYIDGDIIINLDLSELWEMDLNKFALAARRDPEFHEIMLRHPKRIYAEYRTLPFTNDLLMNYFNAGFMCLNLQFIRDNYNFLSDSTNYLISHINTPRADQDALNYLFGDKYIALNPKYNLFPFEVTDDINYCCIHYACRDRKPWFIYHGSIDLQYWKYSLMSPWGENIDMQLNYMYGVANVSKSVMKYYGKLSVTENVSFIIALLLAIFKEYTIRLKNRWGIFVHQK